MKYRPPTKAIIAAAGLGTRFLPQTKAMPKEMLPIVDKPIIQYVVEDLVEAGIETIIIVTGYTKRSIEDHFDRPSGDLLAHLQRGGAKYEHYIEQVEKISQLAKFVYVRQRPQYGNAVPLLDVQHLIDDDEAFIYAYADELIPAEPSLFKQSIARYKELDAPIVPCIKVVKDEDYDNFGIADGKQIRDGVLQMSGMVEKPGKDNAPSDLGVHAGYVFTPDIFSYLQRALDELEEGDELYLKDAIRHMANDGHLIYAVEVEGGVFMDTGSKLDYLKTVVEYALRRKGISENFRAYLEERLKEK